MSRKLRIIAMVAAAILLVLVVAPFLIPVNSFRPTIEQKLSEALARKVELGDLGLSLIRGSLTAENLSIADDPKFSASPFLKAQSLRVGVEIIPLIFSRALHVNSLTIEKPEVTLLRDASGKWNYSSLGGTSSAPAKKQGNPGSSGAQEIAIGKFELTGGRITIGTIRSSKKSVYDRVNASAENVSMRSSFPVTVSAALPGGGSFKLEGKVGPIHEQDASLSPLDAKITIDDFNLASAGVLDTSVAGLGGLMDLNATLVSADGAAKTQGTMKFQKLMLIAGGSPSTVPAEIAFSTHYDLHKSAGVLNPSTVKIGRAIAHLNGTYESSGEATSVNVKLNGQNMPAKDLEAFLPAVGIHLPKGASLDSGTLNADLNLTGPTNHLVTSGTVGLFAAKLSGFDLSSKMAAISALTGMKTGKDLEIQSLTSNVHMAPDGLRAENFNAIVPSLGTLIGEGTIDAKNNLDFKMVATLTAQAASGSAGAAATSAIGSLLGQLGGAKAGGTSANKGTRLPFLIQGTTSDPKFLPDMAGLAGAMFKSQLGNIGKPSNAAPGQQQSNPLDALSGLLKKKKP